MKITSKRANAILNRYFQLTNIAKSLLEFENKWGTFIRFDEGNNILYEVNTSCHCHPTYQTFSISDKRFESWLNYINSLSENHWVREDDYKKWLVNNPKTEKE